jgi:hypothetical protein
MFHWVSKKTSALMALRYNYKYGVIGFWKSELEVEDIPTVFLNESNAKMIIEQSKNNGTTKVEKSLCLASQTKIPVASGGPGKLFPIIHRILKAFEKILIS